MKIVVDCAHGADSQVAPHVFQNIGGEVTTIGVSPDGFNINDMFGATAPANLAMEVKRRKADLGIALDGDADRVVLVDGAGKAYDGDQMLYAIVKHRAAKEKIAGVAGPPVAHFAPEQAPADLAGPLPP